MEPYYFRSAYYESRTPTADEPSRMAVGKGLKVSPDVMPFSSPASQQSTSNDLSPQQLSEAIALYKATLSGKLSVVSQQSYQEANSTSYRSSQPVVAQSPAPAVMEESVVRSSYLSPGGVPVYYQMSQLSTFKTPSKIAPLPAAPPTTPIYVTSRKIAFSGDSTPQQQAATGQRPVVIETPSTPVNVKQQQPISNGGRNKNVDRNMICGYLMKFKSDDNSAYARGKDEQKQAGGQGFKVVAQEYSAYLGLPNDMYSPALMKGNKVLDVPKSYTMSDIRAKPTKINPSERYVSEELPATDVQQPIESPVQLPKIEEPVYDPSTPPNGAAFATVTLNEAAHDDAHSDYHFNRLNDLVSYLDIKH
ncbi:hypothetical protein WR25_04155 [Diploscapter pachys]|uniref:Uncharacterized protein n=1 Tax=Diploscapter pachys TaxID=2018661 RepID=A0A2A2J4R6_9BILA|nr:hypothetical protein WR25_04155 [Diploscapter pachys]